VVPTQTGLNKHRKTFRLAASKSMITSKNVIMLPCFVMQR